MNKWDSLAREEQSARITTLEADKAALTAEVARLREGLTNVVNPIAYLQREAEKQGNRLGPQAYSISQDLGFVQGIARALLERKPDDQG